MNRGDFKVTTPPASEPLTLAEAKAHLKVDFTDDDTLITSLIAAARDYAEQLTGRALLTQTITQTLDAFPIITFRNPYGAIRLFKSPLQTLKTVKYYDTDNALTILYNNTAPPPIIPDTLIVNTIAEPAAIYPAVETTYPDITARPDAIELVYVAGWTSASLVPPAIRQAMLLMIGEMYERRENFVKQLPTAAEHLLRMWSVNEW